MSASRSIVGALLVSGALSAKALAQERELPRALLDEEPRLTSPLALDVDRQLRTARGIEHELSLEQSRVNARSTSDLQQRQTARDVRLSEQRLNTLKTEAPQRGRFRCWSAGSTGSADRPARSAAIPASSPASRPASA